METPPTTFIPENDWLIVKNSIYKNNPLLAEVLCIVNVPNTQHKQFENFVAETSLYGYRRVAYDKYFKKRKIDLSTYPHLSLLSFIQTYKKLKGAIPNV